MVNRYVASLLSRTLLVTLAMGLAFTPAMAAASCGWSVIPSPNAGITEAISAISPSDAWTAGAYVGNDSRQHTRTYRWNGNAWMLVPSPNPNRNESSFTSVSAMSASDAWAVGINFGGGVNTLIEHWNGHIWTIVPSPNPSPYLSVLSGVSAASPKDVWAVGSHSGNGNSVSHALIEHWNGRVWTIVPIPEAADKRFGLSAVSAISASGAWAVGSYVGDDNFSHTLIEQWNGHAWTVVPSPNSGNTYDILRGVSALSASDVWAAGYSIKTLEHGNIFNTLIEHWNGHAWSIVPSPNPSSNSSLYSVSVISRSDVWVAGEYRLNDVDGYTLTEHWNGRMWTVVPSPNAGHKSNRLVGISALSSSDVWAAGAYVGADNIFRTLIEHWKCQGAR
jgi:hypothetical protein